MTDGGIDIRWIDELSQDEKDEILDRSSSTEEVEADVSEILDKVRREGDEGLLELTRRFDDADLESPRVSQDRIDEAYAEVDSDVLEAVEVAGSRIRDFHEEQVREDWRMTEDGIELGRRFVALDSAGAYVPGGGASYPSTALMTVIPAKVAGVERVIACTPPRPNPLTLVALDTAGVDEVYEVGGAQAVGAMAYGTQEVESVDKIVGPGNIFVTAAKKKVQGEVLIDFPAGPSEIGVVADETADPSFIAADILAQSEHDTDAATVLATTSEDLAREVEEAIEERLDRMERSEIAREAEKQILVGNLDECIELMREYSPEHLSIVAEDEEGILDRVKHAGSVFLGEYTPVAAGDYATGTNHVLPTAQKARLYGGLSVDDFVKATTVQRLSKDGLDELRETITTLAREEGLHGHAESVETRFDE